MDGIQAILLGTGTSNGVPMLGYHYPPGYLDNPKNHRTRSSLLLQGPSGNLLVDCAYEMRLQLTKNEVFDLEAVLLTHTHADHIMGMDDLRSFCIKTGEDMPVYSLPRYLEDVRRIFPYAFKQFAPGVFVPRYDLREVPETLDLGGMRIKTFVVSHGEIPVIGLRVNDFAYVTDVSDIPPTAWKFLQNLKTLVLGCIRYRPHPNHFHLEKALEVAKELDADKTYLTHLGHDFDHDVTNGQLPSRVELAYDGLRLMV